MCEPSRSDLLHELTTNLRGIPGCRFPVPSDRTTKEAHPLARRPDPVQTALGLFMTKDGPLFGRTPFGVGRLRGGWDTGRSTSNRIGSMMSVNGRQHTRHGCVGSDALVDRRRAVITSGRLDLFTDRGVDQAGGNTRFTRMRPLGIITRPRSDSSAPCGLRLGCRSR